MPRATHFTADDVRAMVDDGNRYETVHGELLVTPAPGGTHQVVLGRLYRILDRYLEAHGIDDLIPSPADLSFGGDTRIQPDLFVADLTRFQQTRDWADVRTIYLVVEIVSRSSARFDRSTKRELLQERQVPAYWIVDADKRQVEVWTPESVAPAIRRERLVWRHPALTEECLIDLVKLFESR